MNNTNNTDNADNTDNIDNTNEKASTLIDDINCAKVTLPVLLLVNRDSNTRVINIKSRDDIKNYSHTFGDLIVNIDLKMISSGLSVEVNLS